MVHPRCKVSVVLITYNHSPYIRQAIESILAQEVSFPYEILIGEDESTDGTREIVKEFENDYPSLIRAFYRKREDVIYINGRATGRFNFIKTIEAASGEYVAILDGDDYWDSPDKLRLQVELLDRDRTLSACFHSTSQLHENGDFKFAFYHPNLNKKCFSTLDLLTHGNFISTGSTMFRNRIFGDFPDWFYQVEVADWSLHILNSQYGKIEFIDKCMGVYRFHEGGIYSSLSEKEKREIELSFLNQMNRILKYKYNRIIQRNTAGGYLNISNYLKEIGDRKSSIRFAIKSLLCFPYNFGFIQIIIKSLLLLCFPSLERFRKSAKRNSNAK